MYTSSRVSRSACDHNKHFISKQKQTTQIFRIEKSRFEEEKNLTMAWNGLNPYEFHKKLINDYILKKPGDTTKMFVRDTSKDKTDFDVIRENHQFLWDNDDVDSWEKQFAKRYYDKLFKEYCIADLSRYKENKVSQNTFHSLLKRCVVFQF